MDRTPVFCSSQTWKGPNVSTFSSDWDDNLNSYLMAPDVIKPPPQFQDPEEPCQSPPASSTVIRRRDKEMTKTGTKPKERRSRTTSVIEPHKRSLSLSTAIISNKVVTPRRCESYALSYSSSSSEDSGSDSTSARTGDHLPDAVPQQRARSIVLKKAKRRPTPPARTVSLHRLTESKHPERRTQSLYIPSDSQNPMLLPDLIRGCKKEASETEPSTLSPEAPVKSSNQSLASHRSLKEQRLSQQSYSIVGDHVNEATKVPYNFDCNNSPTSTRSSPSQPSISSPTKLPGSASPSSGYSSQCDTPTQPISTVVGPSPLGCRMRPKHSSSVPGQKAKNCKSRLSLQLPEVQPAITNPDPSLVLPKAIRRYSDASRPKQGGSMLAMPVVTQEDLNNVRLRSISSSDLDATPVPVSGVIAEAKEQDASPVLTQSSPKTKPPVAPKPAVSKWPPSAVTGTDSGTRSDVHPQVTNTNYGQDCIYSTVNKVKLNASLSHLSNASSDHKQMQQIQEHINVTSCLQSQCSTGETNALPFKIPTDGNQSTKQKKRRAQGPPVSKRPTLVYTNCDNIAILENLEKHAEPSDNYEKPRSSQQEYHVTVYGFIPTYSLADETQPNAAVTPEHEFYDKYEGQMPETEAVPPSHTTEDLFTIIHRSKRKIFGRKDSFDNKQGDFGAQVLGGVSKTSSQNDNFMALLRRTRSAKASCGSRISATELLKSSKPAASGATELSTYKKHNMMQSHCP